MNQVVLKLAVYHGVMISAEFLADGAYYTKDDFSYLYHEGIIPAIKTRKNFSVNTSCYPRRKSVLAQLFNYDLWRNIVRHGTRWIVESDFLHLKECL